MDRSDLSSFGTVLKAFRTRRGLTQQQLAEQLGVRRNTIGTWERGDFLPGSKGIVLELARHLHLDEQEIRQLLEASLTALAPHWHVPFRRNPFFTGREEILATLHTRLSTDQVVALTHSYALRGLGGIGKTQLALEYAYRHALDYSAVFWIEAETSETAISSLLQFAEVLQLPERQESDQQRVVVAIQRWLSTHNGWLLIWDNLKDLELLSRLLPISLRQGAILLTTRCQALGTLARGMDVVPMAQEEGMLFVLRRAKVLEPEPTEEHMQQFAARLPDEYTAARELVTIMGGLPLALDQAGAYIEETGCGITRYLHLYQRQRRRLLDHRGMIPGDHPDSVVATLELACQRVAQQSPAALELLHFCAFLYPDAIPEELLVTGAPSSGPVVADISQFDGALAALRTLSLVQRHLETQTLSLHRLVQAVLFDTMTEAEREQWTRRAISALDLLFPDVRPATESAIWKQCERLLPHALLCLQQAEALEESLTFASLAYKIAQYLRTRGRYTEAEPLYQRALHVREQACGPDHAQVASSLNDLAILYWCLGKYEQAEPLYRRALCIWEQSLGPAHPQVGASLNNLGFLYRDQGRYAEAEPHYLQALRIWEQSLGPDHPDVAHPLSNLAALYRDQGRHADAEPLARRALRIWEQSLGAEHPLVASALNLLAALARDRGRYAEAERLARQSLSIREQSLGSDHPDVAHPLSTLAELYRDQGRYAEAEPLALRALSIREQYLGLSHPETAQTLHDLALLRKTQGKQSQALFLAERALSIRSQSLGKVHSKTVATQALYEQLLQEQPERTEPTIEHIRTILKARGWSIHLKKQRSTFYVYATRKVDGHTQSRYLAPLGNLAACLAAARVLPHAREGGKANGCLTEND